MRQITKAVDISIIATPVGSLFPYKVDIKGLYTSTLAATLSDISPDKHVLSEDEKKTQEYVTFRFHSNTSVIDYFSDMTNWRFATFHMSLFLRLQPTPSTLSCTNTTVAGTVLSLER